jgi:hypothetical protein
MGNVTDIERGETERERERERERITQPHPGTLRSSSGSLETQPHAPGSGEEKGYKSEPVTSSLCDKPLSLTEPHLCDLQNGTTAATSQH